MEAVIGVGLHLINHLAPSLHTEKDEREHGQDENETPYHGGEQQDDVHLIVIHGVCRQLTSLSNVNGVGV